MVVVAMVAVEEVVMVDLAEGVQHLYIYKAQGFSIHTYIYWYFIRFGCFSDHLASIADRFLHTPLTSFHPLPTS